MPKIGVCSEILPDAVADRALLHGQDQRATGLSASRPGTMTCRLEPITEVERIEPVWRALEERAQCGYFLSWSWVGTWLRELGNSARPMLLTVHESGALAGLAVVVERIQWRHGVIRSRALFINKTGDEALDEITIEYNGLLVEAHRREAVTSAALDYLLTGGWDEVFIDAAQYGKEFCALRGERWTTMRRFPWCASGVDLQAVRESGKNYLDWLSRNTRSQLRRAMRAYEQLGALRVETARTAEEAGAYMGELARLHQAHWTAKGLPGAFGNEFLDRFHRRLIADRLPHGEIQLLRVGFGERWIGYLYSFVWRGAVLSYQSGLDYGVLPGHNRPGGVAHCAAIEYNLRRGARYYDFLGGTGQHKQTLSTTAVALDWVVARRDCLKFRFEDSLRALRDRLAGKQSRSTPAQPTEG